MSTKKRARVSENQREIRNLISICYGTIESMKATINNFDRVVGNIHNRFASKVAMKQESDKRKRSFDDSDDTDESNDNGFFRSNSKPSCAKKKETRSQSQPSATIGSASIDNGNGLSSDTDIVVKDETSRKKIDRKFKGLKRPFSSKQNQMATEDNTEDTDDTIVSEYPHLYQNFVKNMNSDTFFPSSSSRLSSSSSSND